MADGKNESGYALLYALGAIVLTTLIVGAIFLYATRVFFQIDRVDAFKQSKDVGEYALQEATAKIEKKVKKELDRADLTIGFGNDETQLKGLAKTWLTDFKLKESDMGSNKQFSYEVSYKASDLKAQMEKPYLLDAQASQGSYGWKQATSFDHTNKLTNVQLSFPLEVEVNETKNGITSRTILNAEYIYEVQWEKVGINQEQLALDIWRNVFFPYQVPNNAQAISADEWMKKFNQLAYYQSNWQTFDYTEYSDDRQFNVGELNGQIVDVQDGESLDFASTGKKISDLNFAGSFFLNHGAQLRGKRGSRIQTNNLLSIKNQASHGFTNFIQVDAVQANVGTYVNLTNPKPGLVIDVTDFKTSNFFVNASGTQGGQVSSEGVLLAKGNVTTTKISEATSFSFSNYATDALKKDPKDRFWLDFINGSFVVASSNFYAGPVSKGTDLNTTEGDIRKVSVEGNFMLSNVKMTDDSKAVGFSYFDEGTTSKPNPPSTLTLAGPNTSLIVSGQSFIDSPKTARKDSLGGSSFKSYFNDEDYWNKIILKDGARMELGYTGVEPFRLEIEENAYLALKTLPDLLLFDTQFIEESVRRGQLKGKLIIEPYNQGDGNQLKDIMKENRVAYTSVSTRSDALKADEGQVVIIMPTNTAGKDSSFILSRTFDYLSTIEY